jgi:hypothetical protein
MGAKVSLDVRNNKLVAMSGVEFDMEVYAREATAN